jgi:hypothetical protein
MAYRTWPQSGWPPAPPGCGRRTPAWTTRLRRSVPPADTRRWLAGWRTWRTSRASGRPDIPVQCDRPADGYGPGPDGGGEAADTSSAQRPTMRLASRPRPTTRRPRPGPDRTGQDSNAHAPFGQPQQLPASGPVRRDHLHPMLDAGTSASLVPVRCPRGRVRRPRWTPRSDRLRTPPAPSYPAGHRPLHPARHGKPEATRTGNRRTAPKAFGHPRSPPPQGGPPGHAEPPPVGPAFAAWQPRLARRWQDCQHDRNHGSDQAATWCRSTVQAAPRRIALLRQCRVERRANGEASSVMAWLAGAVRVTWTRFGCWCVAEQGSSHMRR